MKKEKNNLLPAFCLAAILAISSGLMGCNKLIGDDSDTGTSSSGSSTVTLKGADQ